MRVTGTMFINFSGPCCSVISLVPLQRTDILLTPLRFVRRSIGNPILHKQVRNYLDTFQHLTSTSISRQTYLNIGCGLCKERSYGDLPGYCTDQQPYRFQSV
jgi:hypothetical protein